MTDIDTSAEAVERLIHDCDLAAGALRRSPSKRAILRDSSTALRALLSERDALKAERSVLEETLAHETKEARKEERKIANERVGYVQSQCDKKVAEARNAALEEAAEEAMRENERRLNLASIRVPAMACEIAEAIRALKETSQ